MNIIKKIGVYFMALVSVWGMVDILYRFMDWFEDCSELYEYSEGRFEVVVVIAMIAASIGIVKYFHRVAKNIGKETKAEKIEAEEG